MLIKLGIIAGVLVLGGMMFSTEITSLFPSTSALLADSLKNDIDALNSKVTNSAENRLDSSIDKQFNGIRQAIKNKQLKHFAIANPIHAPYGLAASEILQKQDLWTLIQPYLVLGENAAQTTQFVRSGAAQVGLISYSLALTPTVKNNTQSLLIPADWHQPLKQTAVLLKGAGETAKLFYNYLQQNKAQQTLSHYGYE